jgi:UDP-N-acetylmuramate: L-alanyl-gamma-D-glutamyl-meso-diaminopimelate ligase
LLLANGDDPNVESLLGVTHCPIKRFGLGEGNAVRAMNVRLGATASEFELPSFKFHLNLVGELNVRNALAAVACARHCGISNHQIQEAFSTFRSVRRRMEVRGVPGGVTVVDDFGHHPTAIRETLRALRIKYGAEKIWAIFEPRTNTTRRNIFQQELREAFSDADVVLLAPVARAELLAPDTRLDTGLLIESLRTAGKQAELIEGVDAMVERVVVGARGGDVVCVFSNGGFGGIHEKLLGRLGK